MGLFLTFCGVAGSPRAKFLYKVAMEPLFYLSGMRNSQWRMLVLRMDAVCGDVERLV
jgi:hypothetical protein